MEPINFTTKLYSIGTLTILRVPQSHSAMLKSRGQTMVAVTINTCHFTAPLEPDGQGSHWLGLTSSMCVAASVNAGDTVNISLEPIDQWVEPEIPSDLAKAVAAFPEVQALWDTITPMSRWEWVRWTRSTNNPETRQKRIEVACSKLKAGKRRPCCWNRNLCTDPTVSKSGLLLGPEQ